MFEYKLSLHKIKINLLITKTNMGQLCCGGDKENLVPDNAGGRRGTNVPSMKNFTGLKRIEASKTIKDHYNFFEKPLGEGSFGTVFRAEHKSMKT